MTARGKPTLCQSRVIFGQAGGGISPAIGVTSRPPAISKPSGHTLCRDYAGFPGGKIHGSGSVTTLLGLDLEVSACENFVENDNPGMFPRRPVQPVVRSSVLLLAMLFLGRESSWSMPMVSDYVIHVWRAENGLPQDSVTSVLQTHQGYIWIGTYGALARFDGAHFTVFDTGNTPSLLNSRVTSLFEARNGTLWIGHEDGAVTHYRSGQFETGEFEDRWTDKGIYHIGEDGVGDIWLASRDCELSRLRDGRTCHVPAEKNREWGSIATSPNGIWIANDDMVFALRHGELTRMDLGSQSLEHIRGICPGLAGGFWVANNGSLQEWKGTNCVRDLGAMPWGLNPLTVMFETRAGTVVAGTFNQGLYLVSGRGKALHFCRTNGLPSDWVTSAIEDREGDLWVGTRAGLVMLHATGITVAAPPDKYDGCPVLSVAIGKEGQLWAATEGDGIYRLEDGQWTHFGKKSGLSNAFVWSVSLDASGRLWAGTWGGGVFVLNGNVFRRPPGLNFSLPALAVYHEPDGDTWVGTSEGLLRYHNDRAEWVVRRQQWSSPDVRCMVRGGNGALWFGMFGGGLGCLKDGKVRQFRKADGLPSDFVQCLRWGDSGSLWIGTFGGGLVRLKNGRFATINRRQGLPGNDIGDIEDDGRGFFWISCNRGIVRVSRAGLNACADGLMRGIHCQLLTENEGVPTMGCSGGLQPSGCKTPDGRLLFPSSEGIVTIDPGLIQTNWLRPPVFIEKVLVDNHTMRWNSGAAPLRIPPGQHRLEVRYAALSYSAPDRVFYKYRLDGMDKKWVCAGSRHTAQYNYLPLGKYVFHVIACNNDGVWNQTGAKMSFVVLPYFWQTLWFRVLAGAAALFAAGGIVWLDAQRRLQHKLKRLEQQRAVEQERARIAHDIHDDLGTYLTRITMLSDPARSGSGNGSQAAASLQCIHKTATELTEAMSETVWAVNPHHDTLDSLVNYLQKFAQEFLEHAGIRCRLDVPFQLPAWSLSAETRHNLFLAFKEALNNVVKHAGATETHIGLALESAGFMLVIRDNGRGIAKAGSSEGVGKNPAGFKSGNGLKNMQRRMEKIGGQCEIRTVPPCGTSVEFKVPVRTSGG